MARQHAGILTGPAHLAASSCSSRTASGKEAGSSSLSAASNSCGIQRNLSAAFGDPSSRTPTENRPPSFTASFASSGEPFHACSKNGGSALRRPRSRSISISLPHA
ncbi:hypothetical protein AC781_02420 [Akkermansia glycaniphila]|nr:hypothetical protein AC781_02420 [Akkermansia glycaniphila]